MAATHGMYEKTNRFYRSVWTKSCSAWICGRAVLWRMLVLSQPKDVKPAAFQRWLRSIGEQARRVSGVCSVHRPRTWPRKRPVSSCERNHVALCSTLARHMSSSSHHAVRLFSSLLSGPLHSDNGETLSYRGLSCYCPMTDENRATWFVEFESRVVQHKRLSFNRTMLHVRHFVRDVKSNQIKSLYCSRRCKIIFKM